MSDNGRRRLTSWKEIAAHVGRDVRTVLRWEKHRGLPVHRVPGSTGRVVFAYTDELDAWSRGLLTKGGDPEGAESREPTPNPAPAPPSLDVVAEPASPPRSRTVLALVALVLVAAAGFATWRIAAARNTGAPLTISVTEAAIVATADGDERWRHAFPPGERTILIPGRPADLLDDGGVLAATAYTDGPAGNTLRGGELFRFSSNGRVEARFTFTDRVQFAGAPYGPPWGISDYRAHGTGAARRVAVVAHHLEWWPSVLTILDNEWRRRGTFVNAGWIERLHWVSPDRLMIAGFSNAFDGGMVGILDAAAIDGQSPGDDPTYTCVSCGPGGPLRYIILPRSEVNMVTASPFNRVIFVVKPETVLARTVEVPAIAQAADALYEFTPSLDLIRASYSDRYWELHRELEFQGKISHSREQCPDRNGPRQLRVWEPESGWSTIATAPSRAPSSPAQSRR